MGGSLSCQRVARNILSFPRPHHWPVSRVAGEARRFTRNRRTWKRIAELSDLDADLRRDRRFRKIPKVLETPKGKDLKEDVKNLKVLRELL